MKYCLLYFHPNEIATVWRLFEAETYEQANEAAWNCACRVAERLEKAGWHKDAMSWGLEERTPTEFSERLQSLLERSKSFWDRWETQ